MESNPSVKLFSCLFTILLTLDKEPERLLKLSAYLHYGGPMSISRSTDRPCSGEGEGSFIGVNGLDLIFKWGEIRQGGGYLFGFFSEHRNSLNLILNLALMIFPKNVEKGRKGVT
jgi:hypothetical protein